MGVYMKVRAANFLWGLVKWRFYKFERVQLSPVGPAAEACKQLQLLTVLELLHCLGLLCFPNLHFQLAWPFCIEIFETCLASEVRHVLICSMLWMLSACDVYKISSHKQLHGSSSQCTSLFLYFAGISLIRSIQASKAESLLISINLYTAVSILTSCPFDVSCTF